MSARRLPLHTRVAARVYTGRAGHLYGGVVDWLVVVWRIAFARVRRTRAKS